MWALRLLNKFKCNFARTVLTWLSWITSWTRWSQTRPQQSLRVDSTEATMEAQVQEEELISIRRILVPMALEVVQKQEVSLMPPQTLTSSTFSTLTLANLALKPRKIILNMEAIALKTEGTPRARSQVHLQALDSSTCQRQLRIKSLQASTHLS